VDRRLGALDRKRQAPPRLSEPVGQLSPLRTQRSRGRVDFGQPLCRLCGKPDTARGRSHHVSALSFRVGHGERRYGERFASGAEGPLQAQRHDDTTFSGLSERHHQLAPARDRPDVHVVLRHLRTRHGGHGPGGIRVRSQPHLSERRVANIQLDVRLDRQRSVIHVAEHADIRGQRSDDVLRLERQRIRHGRVLVGVHAPRRQAPERLPGEKARVDLSQPRQRRDLKAHRAVSPQQHRTRRPDHPLRHRRLQLELAGEGGDRALVLNR